ncbi:MAG: polysaccharide deacetylase family protein [Oscillospiraceae bacterium]|nr:polysaccharide deacetylase family protein [Oscillospiraceae bacterium]
MKQYVSALLVIIFIVILSTFTVVFGTAAGTPVATTNHVGFIDIENHEAKSAIEKWARKGVIPAANDGLFRPDDDISRAELAAIIVRLIGYSDISCEKPFDISESDWFYSDIMKLVSANVIRLSNGYARPFDSATREEAIVMIARAFRIADRIESEIYYIDSDEISTWALGLVHYMQQSGYLRIFDNRLMPSKNITRAETIMMIDSMIAEIYTEPGIYSETIEGSLIISSSGVVLSGATIKGNIYVVEGIGQDGYFTIDENTVVDWYVYVWAGRHNPFPHINPNAPMVALTFDDGPTSTTVAILNTLEAYNARATFFVVGRSIYAHQDTLRRAVSLGCELGSHTWTHRRLTSMSADELIRDTERVSNAIFDVAQVRPVFVRPPEGSYNAASNRTVGSMGMATVFWSVDPQDWSHRNANTTNTRVLNAVKDGAIILLHDLVVSTGTAVETLVPALIESGYQLVTLSELLTYSDIGIEAGAFYVSKYSYRQS